MVLASSVRGMAAFFVWSVPFCYCRAGLSMHLHWRGVGRAVWRPWQYQASTRRGEAAFAQVCCMQGGATRIRGSNGSMKNNARRHQAAGLIAIAP